MFLSSFCYFYAQNSLLSIILYIYRILSLTMWRNVDNREMEILICFAALSGEEGG